MDRPIYDYDPSLGMAFQGDVAIIPLPSSICVDRAEEIPAKHGSLILQEGEVTGHFHAIDLRLLLNASAAVEGLMADALAGNIPIPTARLYRDHKAVDALRRAGIIERADLCVGILSVEIGPIAVCHPEHDGIRLPVGLYYIGRQVESAGAEERKVQD